MFSIVCIAGRKLLGGALLVLGDYYKLQCTVGLRFSDNGPTSSSGNLESQVTSVSDESGSAMRTMTELFVSRGAYHVIWVCAPSWQAMASPASLENYPP